MLERNAKNSLANLFQNYSRILFRKLKKGHHFQLEEITKVYEMLLKLWKSGVFDTFEL